MNALINLKDCREYMTITLNNKDHQVSAGCASRIKLAGTIDDPYFCGRDVCDVLGYENIQQALYLHVKQKHKKELKVLKDELQLEINCNSLGSINSKILTYHEGKAVYVNEPGLYSLIMKSKAKFAEAFQDLVYEVILPSIRKYGSYQIEQQLNESFEKLAIKDKELEIEKERVEKAEAAAKIANFRALTLESLSIVHRERLKDQHFYIVTTQSIAKDGEFKIGGFEAKNCSVRAAAKKRLGQYNTGSSGVHPEARVYFVAIYQVSNYKQVEARIKELIAPFRSKIHKNTENFNLHINILKPLVEAVVKHYNVEIDKLNKAVKDLLDWTLQVPPVGSNTLKYIDHLIPDAFDIESLSNDYEMIGETPSPIKMEKVAGPSKERKKLNFDDDKNVGSSSGSKCIQSPSRVPIPIPKKLTTNNELADWIFENVEVTNQIEDVVSLNDLKDKYKNNYGLRGVSDRDFMAIAKALFTSKGFEIKDRFQFRINGIKKEKRNVVLRIKLVDDIEV